jgi:FtsP/CotA-like multicopper oxidase with cupredoxin domain
MQSRRISAVVVVALVAAAAVLFFVLREDDSGDSERVATTATTTAAQEKEQRPEPKPQVASIVVEGGEPVGGVEEIEVARGDRVRFDVRADVAEEVHVHGYDVIEDVAPGKVARFDFPADIEGGFEVELEGSHTQIAELTVGPG